MLKTNEVLENFDLIERDTYKDMIKAVNLPDFYKCIAQFAGLNISEVKDEMIVKYLKIWAKNKYKFFKMLGNKTQLDIPFTYDEMDDDRANKYFEIEKQFPVYALWLKGFHEQSSLKVSAYYLDWGVRASIEKYFPNFNIEGTAITHFFKKYLQAPDELITAIGRIYENNRIEATFTMSIDPVDIMLASENPYNWCSCYRLETGDREGSHADGCMAAVLDSASIISYVWNNHGKFTLYNKFKFTDIRYKRMRMWLAFSSDLKAIHFNDIYPGRSDYKPEFHKQIRGLVEEVVAKHLGEENTWKSNPNRTRYDIERVNPYGYSEYDFERIYMLKSIYDTADGEIIKVFDEKIEDALGEGFLQGSYPCGGDWNGDYEDEDSIMYSGDGFLVRNYEKKHWCERGDCYCEYMTEDGECTDPDCCYNEEDEDEDEEED